MQQISALWTGLDARRKAIAVLASIAVFAAILGLTHVASKPGTALLYAGLDGAQAADVIAALDQEGVAYEVRGESVYVDATRRDELRMILAGQGLPSNTGAGYELLDNLSGFGTTSQMFDAAYWRAKEGELARTIVASPAIRSARIHIANPSPNPFQRGMTPTASVTVTPVSGSFPAEQARALRFLVASAVAGLDMSNVTVIDATSGKVIGGDTEDDSTAQAEAAAELKKRVERLLEARVGPGRAIVEVSIDRVLQRESIFERRIDPESRTAISTDTEESASNARGGGANAVTVASNLPSGDAGQEGEGSQSQSSQTRERTNFEISETTREIVRDPGAISRLTVAVLVDGLRTEGEWTARSEIEMADLRDLVASAVGYDEARGDVITLRSMEFETPVTAGTEVSSGMLENMPLSPMRLIQLAVLALVALALGLFVVRPVLLNRRDDAADALALGAPVIPAEVQLDDAAALAQASQPATLEGSQPLGLPDGTAVPRDGDIIEEEEAEPEDPIALLHQVIAERQPDALEILKAWIEDEPRKESA